jgi:hypothetical protein
MAISVNDKAIKYIYPEKRTSLTRFLSFVTSVIIISMFFRLIIIYRQILSKPVIIPILAASLTALFTWFLNLVRDYIDKCKDRYNDLVYIDLELNIALNALRDNIDYLKPLTQEQPVEYGVVIIPEAISLSADKLMSVWNGKMLNEFLTVYDDCRRINSFMEIIKTSYDNNLRFIDVHDHNAKPQVSYLNATFKNQAIDLSKYINAYSDNIENIISFVIAYRKYLSPNLIKYIWWFLTDWGFNIFDSFKGFMVGPRYVKLDSLTKEASIILEEWRSLRDNKLPVEK